MACPDSSSSLQVVRTALNHVSSAAVRLLDCHWLFVTAGARRDRILRRWPKLPNLHSRLARISEFAELELENSRLRRLVTDLLLENVKLSESVRSYGAAPSKEIG
jgi:hypothetical protein